MTFEEAVEKMIEHCRQIVEETPEEIGWEFKEIAEALSSPPARSARDEAIERTATLLRNRLRSIAEHPDFKTVFDIARAHWVPYAGPNWEEEERNLSEALAMPKGGFPRSIIPNTITPEGKKFWDGVERGAAEYDAMPKELKGKLGSREPKSKENESWRFLLGEACCLGLQSNQRDEFILFLDRCALHVTGQNGKPFCEDSGAEMSKGEPNA